MDGRNLFESGSTILQQESASVGPRPGVFISFSRRDKDKSRQIARMLKASKVDYYFDEDDKQLRLADEEGDHLKVVQCIKNGLEVCTHLLGIITEHTKDSWWVPYEIGRATGRDRNCAHLIDKDVSELPSYIKAAKVIANRAELQKWLPAENAKRSIESHVRVELNKAIALTDCPPFIPTNRKMDDLSFY